MGFWIVGRDLVWEERCKGWRAGGVGCCGGMGDIGWVYFFGC